MFRDVAARDFALELAGALGGAGFVRGRMGGWIFDAGSAGICALAVALCDAVAGVRVVGTAGEGVAGGGKSGVDDDR